MEEEVMDYRITISLEGSYYNKEVFDLLDLDINPLTFLEKAYGREYRLYCTFATEEEALIALQNLEARIEFYHRTKSSRKIPIIQHTRGFTVDFIHIFVEQNLCPISTEKEIYKEVALHGDSEYLHELLFQYRHFSNLDTIKANVKEILSLMNK